MKTVLVISSQVATSRVGGTAAQFCLQKLGVKVIFLPTTLLGRHPGWGAPGGGPVNADMLRSMWQGVLAQNIHFDGVLTGYFAQDSQIDFAAELIDKLKSKNPDLPVLIDPVMGDRAHQDDSGSLYIPKPRALKIIHDLVIPHASIATPNRWEMDYIREQLDGAQSGPAAKIMIVTSQTNNDADQLSGQIGSDLIHGTRRHTLRHERFGHVPNGCGDSLAALYLGHTVLGASAERAHTKAVSSLFAIIRRTVETGAQELALEDGQDFIMRAPLLTAGEHIHSSHDQESS